MTYTENDITLFDQFMEGTLSDKEVLLFEERLQSDVSFKQLFDNYQADSKAIAQAHDQIILESIGKAEKKYFRKKKRTIAAIIITTVILLTAYITYFFISNSEHYIEHSSEEYTYKSTVNVTDTTPISLPKKNDTDSITLKKQKEIIRKSEPKIIKHEENSIINESSPPSGILIPLYQTITRNSQTTISKNGDHIIVNCPEKIQSIIPFEKNDKQYLLLDRNLFVLRGDTYQYTNDNRPAELIQKSTGRGKKITVELRYFDFTTQELVNLNNTKVIVDKDTTDIKNLNIDNTYSIFQRYFLPIDLINLSNAN